MRCVSDHTPVACITSRVQEGTLYLVLNHDASEYTTAASQRVWMNTGPIRTDQRHEGGVSPPPGVGLASGPRMLACGRRPRIQKKLSKASPGGFRERDEWSQCAGRVRAQPRRVIERAERGRDDRARNPCMVVSDKLILTGIPEEQDIPAPVTTTIRRLLATASDSWVNARRDIESEEAVSRLRVVIGILFCSKGARPRPMRDEEGFQRGERHVTLFMFTMETRTLYITIATKKTVPKTTPVDMSRVVAPPVVGGVVDVDAAPLVAVVDVPKLAEAMVVNDPGELVKVNLLFVSVVGTAPVDVAPVIEAVETVEPETDVEVGPGTPLLVTKCLRISGHSHPRQKSHTIEPANGLRLEVIW